MESEHCSPPAYGSSPEEASKETGISPRCSSPHASGTPRRARAAQKVPGAVVPVPLHKGLDVVVRCAGAWRSGVVVRPPRGRGRVGVVDTESWTERQVRLADVAIKANLVCALTRSPKVAAQSARRAAAARAAHLDERIGRALAAVGTSSPPTSAGPCSPGGAAASEAARTPVAVTGEAAVSDVLVSASTLRSGPGGDGRSEPSLLLLKRSRCRPEQAGLDVQTLRKADEVLHAKVRRGEVPGVVSVVFRHGVLAHLDCFGYADLERQTPLRADSIVRLYSMTKSIVSVAVAVCLEDGLLQLEDPVSKFIPAFANMQVAREGGGAAVPAERPITVLHLLTHTAGLGYGPMLGDQAEGDAELRFLPLIERSGLGRTAPRDPRAITTLEQWCNEVARIPLQCQPGTEWLYSYSHDVAGRVVEVATGQRLDAFLHRRLLGPLRMVDTGFDVPHEKWDRVAGTYRRVEVAGPRSSKGSDVQDKVDGASVRGEAAEENTMYEFRRLDGSDITSHEWVAGNSSPILAGGGSVDAMTGGMVSTAADYARFCLMLLRKGELDGVRILRPDTVELLTTNQLPRATGKADVWAFGTPGVGFGLVGSVSVQHPELDAALRPGEYGWGGMAGTAWTNDPTEDFFLLSFSLTAFDLTTEEELRAGVRAAIVQFEQRKEKAELRRIEEQHRREGPEGAAATVSADVAATVELRGSSTPSKRGASSPPEDQADRVGKQPRRSVDSAKTPPRASPQMSPARSVARTLPTPQQR